MLHALCRSSEVLMPAIGFLVTPHSLRLTPCGILRGCPERRGEYFRHALCAMLEFVKGEGE
jgi:hypothetical protein